MKPPRSSSLPPLAAADNALGADALAAAAAAGFTSRRTWLKTGSLVLLLGNQQIARGASILAVRVWPAPEYSRVTLESDTVLKARQFFVTTPPRLAVDIEGIDLSPQLRELVAKVHSDDPNIAGIRVGQNAPGVVRLVIDLKQAAKPQVFALPPVAAYGHRLVFDLYPEVQIDPLATLIAERLKAAPDRVATSAPGSAVAAARDALSSVPRSETATTDPLGDLIAQAGGSRSAAGAGAKIDLPDVPVATDVASTVLPGKRSAVQAQAQAQVQMSPSAQSPAVPTGRKTDRLIIVALDPGHGGEDPGATGPKGTHEKDVVLKVAHLLRDRINATTVGGNPMRAYLTRDADFFVPLGTRVQKAQRVQADLFISIHADAFTNPAANGASVFALSEGGASSSAARWLANKENQADLVGGLNESAQEHQVQRALIDMSTTAQINDSLKLGSVLLGEVGKLGKLHKPHVEQAGFAVLKAPDIPSVLVETAFISNPDEEQRLASPAYQEQLADALMRGIKSYFARNPPLARSRSV